MYDFIFIEILKRNIIYSPLTAYSLCNFGLLCAKKKPDSAWTVQLEQKIVYYLDFLNVEFYIWLQLGSHLYQKYSLAV